MSPIKFIKSSVFLSFISLGVITSVSSFSAENPVNNPANNPNSLPSTSTFTASPNASMSMNNLILNNGIYVLGDLGAASLQTPSENLPNTNDASHAKYQFAWGLGLGYLYFDTQYQFVGVELGYDHNGKAIYKGTVSSGSEMGNSVQTNIEQYDFDMLFDLGFTTPIGLNIIGKAGMARVSQNISGQSDGTPNAFTGRNDLTRYVPKAEIGLGWIANSNTDVLLNYARLFGKDINNFPADNSKIFANNILTLSVSYVLPE